MNIQTTMCIQTVEVFVRCCRLGGCCHIVINDNVWADIRRLYKDIAVYFYTAETDGQSLVIHLINSPTVSQVDYHYQNTSYLQPESLYRSRLTLC